MIQMCIRDRIWFDSVAATAADYDIPTIMPDNPNTPDELQRIRDLTPDFLFSFYYRQMLTPELLAIAPRGALNMHGSLLPKYRGRVPVNWAIIHGESDTGPTLHYICLVYTSIRQPSAVDAESGGFGWNAYFQPGADRDLCAHQHAQ